MPINSKDKGRRGELELSHILKTYGFNTRRSVQYCGANGDADVVGLPGIHIECKRVENLNIYNAMMQAEADARPGEVPAVFHRKNNKPWLVTIPLEEFMTIYSKYKEGRG